jgi:hypothetical protein
MITSNALQRTLHIKHGESSATGFAIDYDGRQYLITAKHVVEGGFDVARPATIEIFHDNRWKALSVALVGEAKGPIDIAVFAPKIQLAPTHPLPPTTANAFLGQDTYFLGFPFGLQANIGALNRDLPLPLVKRAVLSAFLTEPDGTQIWLLDGFNNPGFSGGPVLYAPDARRPSSLNVGAVISAYRYAEASVLEGGAETPLKYRYNTGIIIAHCIEHAIEVIEQNPIGFELPPNE